MERVPWAESLVSSPATVWLVPCLPWLAAVLTCTQGKVCPLSLGFLLQDRAPGSEFRAEETNTTLQSIGVNFAVQREVVDAQYSASKFLCICWKGEIRYYDQKVHISVVFHGNCWGAETTSKSITLRKSVGRISIDFVLPFVTTVSLLCILL